MVLDRDGEEYTVEIEPRQLEGDAYAKLGVVGGETVKPGFFGSIQYGAYTVKYWINYYHRQSEDACHRPDGTSGSVRAR